MAYVYSCFIEKGILKIFNYRMDQVLKQKQKKKKLTKKQAESLKNTIPEERKVTLII